MKRDSGPIGASTRDSARRRARRSSKYRAERERLAEFEGIARLVIVRRAALGLSQKELADRMGTSHSAISRIESGRYRTGVETLRRLAEAFDERLVVGFERGPASRPQRDLVRV